MYRKQNFQNCNLVYILQNNKICLFKIRCYYSGKNISKLNDLRLPVYLFEKLWSYEKLSVQQFDLGFVIGLIF